MSTSSCSDETGLSRNPNAPRRTHSAAAASEPGLKTRSRSGWPWTAFTLSSSWAPAPSGNCPSAMTISNGSRFSACWPASSEVSIATCQPGSKHCSTCRRRNSSSLTRRIRSIIIDLEFRTSRRGGEAWPRSPAARSSQTLLLQQVSPLLAFDLEQHGVAGDGDDFRVLDLVADEISLAVNQRRGPLWPVVDSLHAHGRERDRLNRLYDGRQGIGRDRPGEGTRRRFGG